MVDQIQRWLESAAVDEFGDELGEALLIDATEAL
jgi:hypothetical protein